MHSFALPTSDSKETALVPARPDGRNVPATGDIFAEALDGSAATLLDPHARHRREFARYSTEDGDETYRAVIAPLYAAWDGWNGAHFGNELLPPHFLLAEPSCPQALGDYSRLSNWGSTSQIRIRRSLWNGSHPLVRDGEAYAEGRRRLVFDVALHEAVHQYATEFLGKPEEAYRGHGPIFRDECNRIGDKMGLPRVRAAKARGLDRNLPSCAHWPFNIRPAGYYQGAYLPHEGQAADDADTDEQAAPPDPPKLLADWLNDHPDWKRRYHAFGMGLFKALDCFFALNQAPLAVQAQAVQFWARAYCYQLRTRPPRRAGPPARMGS